MFLRVGAGWVSARSAAAADRPRVAVLQDVLSSDDLNLGGSACAAAVSAGVVPVFAEGTPELSHVPQCLDGNVEKGIILPSQDLFSSSDLDAGLFAHIRAVPAWHGFFAEVAAMLRLQAELADVRMSEMAHGSLPWFRIMPRHRDE